MWGRYIFPEIYQSPAKNRFMEIVIFQFSQKVHFCKIISGAGWKKTKFLTSGGTDTSCGVDIFSQKFTRVRRKIDLWKLSFFNFHKNVHFNKIISDAGWNKPNFWLVGVPVHQVGSIYFPRNLPESGEKLIYRNFQSQTSIQMTFLTHKFLTASGITRISD